MSDLTTSEQTLFIANRVCFSFFQLIAPIRHGFVTALKGQDDIVIVCGDKIVRDLVVVCHLNVELAVFDHQRGFARLTRHKYIII